MKDKSRLLRKMEAEAAEKARVEREKRVSQKYRKVRFVDKQKVSRKLARVDKKLQGHARGGNDALVRKCRLHCC